MSEYHKTLQTNELAAYRHWCLAVRALAKINEKRNAARRLNPSHKQIVYYWNSLHRVAMAEEQDAYERWKDRCNELDEELSKYRY